MKNEDPDDLMVLYLELPQELIKPGLQLIQRLFYHSSFLYKILRVVANALHDFICTGQTVPL